VDIVVVSVVSVPDEALSDVVGDLEEEDSVGCIVAVSLDDEDGVDVVVVDVHEIGNVDGHDESLGWKQAVDWVESVQYSPKHTLLSVLQKLP
jgi:hypothetical protein